ncbi:hypothetical protein ACFWNS_40490, partial [Streptomyces sp. NPDC058418]
MILKITKINPERLPAPPSGAAGPEPRPGRDTRTAHQREAPMSWFKIDDGFHCHAKVLAAGTPAVGLYVRCGSWAAQQASDGIVPKAVARMYGTPRMIKALVDADLWHAKGHECASCPELDANSYAIHQFLERNPSRVD